MIQIDPMGYWRDVDSIMVHKRQSELIMPSYNGGHLDPSKNDQQMLIIEIKAKSFIRQQIRMMMLSAVNYARGASKRE